MAPFAEKTSSKPAAQPRVQLNVAIPPGLKARLTVAASRRACFEAAIVREALEAFLDASEHARGRP